MAIVEMTQRNYPHAGYTYSETIANGANGDTVRILPQRTAKKIACTLIAGANTGKFQVSTSSDTAITAGTETWQDWAEGTTTGTVSDVLNGPVTAIRGVSASGEINIEIVI